MFEFQNVRRAGLSRRGAARTSAPTGRGLRPISGVAKRWGVAAAAAATLATMLTAPAPAGGGSMNGALVQNTQPPSPPRNVRAEPQDGAADVSWTAPASHSGGLGITRYTATASPDGESCTTRRRTANPTHAARTYCTIRGLTNGTLYTFTVTARTSDGTSPASAPSNPIRPPGTTVGPPTGVSATPGNGSATVSWNAPANDGGSPVSGYTALASGIDNIAGQRCHTTVAGTANPTRCTITGLVNGVDYTFTVTARNNFGDTRASAPSAPVRPSAPGTTQTQQTHPGQDPDPGTTQTQQTHSAQDPDPGTTQTQQTHSAQDPDPGTTQTQQTHSAQDPDPGTTQTQQTHPGQDPGPGTTQTQQTHPGQDPDPGTTQTQQTHPGQDPDPVTLQTQRTDSRGGGGGAGPEEAQDRSPADEFSDLPETGVLADAVRDLAAAGVLARTGCAEGLLCPNKPILRWEMAVWLVRALDGADPDPPPSSRFADVDAGEWWAGHVERLADLGITPGCSSEPLRYCPGDHVARGQMASFLVRAFDLAAAPAAGFTDTASSTHRANIDALYAAGITVGCSTEPLLYCPQRSTTRAQMASFLTRALDTSNSSDASLSAP